ncbi:MAG: DUF1566 domain-containing protein [Burkholderiaceae bacterium]|nr:DUF1566 domain-containing protein [Burkholderiaceae bacterium]
MLSRTARHRLIGCLAFGLTMAAAAAPAVAPDAAPDAPDWVLSEDGAYVVNLSAQLAWPRCVEGMQWNGKTCTGRPLLLDHAEAIALAGARSEAEGVHWRVPTVTELKRLVNKTAHPPGLNPVLFPAAPRDWHWSITANVDTTNVNPYNYGNVMRGRTGENAIHMAYLHGWAVNLATGEARGDVAKRIELPVRLVRSQD